MTQNIDSYSIVNSAIMNSKLFLSSSRKQVILSAIQNPINMPLVEQLADAIKDPVKHVDHSEASDESSTEEDEEDNEIYDEEFNDTFAPHDVDNSSLATLDTLDSYSDSEVDSSPDAEPKEQEETEPAEQEEVEESESISGTPVTACVQVDTECLKGSLNGVSETAGVSRIFMKGDECWIYYNDDINLNTVMSAVIEYINASGMTYLEFNRLARSDNAIVFIKHEEAQPIDPVVADKE